MKGEAEMNDSIETLRQDISNHAKTLTALIEEGHSVKKLLDEQVVDRAVRKVRDENLYERLDRIEASVKRLQAIGVWILAAFGVAFLTAAANFIIQGGLRASLVN